MLKLQVIGNLGKDCTTNAVNGSNVINFNVAHSDKSRDADNNPTEKTIWVECAYWTEKTGVVPFLRKGQQVYLEGLPEVKTYLKKDGTTGTSTDWACLLGWIVKIFRSGKNKEKRSRR
jgi:single-strand DNA-binding protein